MSPLVPAAKTLPDLVHSGGTLRLSEHPLDNRDSGFSFTYMQPRVLDETGVAWKTDECFNQVEMVYQEGLHCFYLSPYIGWGLRLRQTLLTVAPGEPLKGRGVCVVIPENLDQTTAENILLTSLAWLSDLGLNDVKLVAHHTVL